MNDGTLEQGPRQRMRGAGGPRRGWWVARLLVFSAWFALVVFLESRHVFWRDEGRTWSIALQGNTVFAMLRELQGEGHPAVWYLMLRIAHDVFGSPLVLPVVTVGVMAAAAALLVFASPFPLWLSGLILATDPFVYEYSVIARNYGISALLMLLLALLYRRHRERGVWLGVVAALLANTNAHSVLLACAFMLFWLLDLGFEGRVGWNRATRLWAINGVIVTVGIIACVITIYPTYNDAAVSYMASGGLRGIVNALLLPASTFDRIAIHRPAEALGIGPITYYPRSLPYRVMSAVLIGSVLGLIRRPAALIAGGVALLALSLFFAVVYFGFYRHEALWLMFMVALYWMAGEGVRAGRWLRSWVAAGGLGCFVVLLALQVPISVRKVVSAVHGVPSSQVRNLAETLAARPDLREAILLPDPDYLLEGLPYYGSNPIYLPREHRFAKFSRYSTHVEPGLSLADLLGEARTLCQAHQAPVVIVIQQDLDALSLPATVKEGYNFEFRVTAAGLAALKASTKLLGRFAPSVTDESFWAYVLRPPCSEG